MPKNLKKKSKITSISSVLILCIIKANLAYSIALTRQNDIIINKNKKNIRWRWSECYSSIFPSPSANNCFSIIAQVLSNSVLNSANKESTAHCYNCDDYLYQDEYQLQDFFLSWIGKNFILLFYKVLCKSSSIFGGLRNLISFYFIYHLLMNIWQNARQLFWNLVLLL